MEDFTVSSLEPMMLWVVEKAWLVDIVKSLLSEPNFLRLFLDHGELSLCDYLCIMGGQRRGVMTVHRLRLHVSFCLGVPVT